MIPCKRYITAISTRKGLFPISRKVQNAHRFPEIGKTESNQKINTTKELAKQNTHNRAKVRQDNGVLSKTEIIEQAGFTVKQAQRFETLAKNRDIVEQAKAEARENDDAGAKASTKRALVYR